MKSQISLLAALVLAAAVSAQVTFVQAPAMVSSGTNQWTITFQVSQNTDVEVSIVNRSDSTVVRHLAAGVLGAAPPAPFAADSLLQTLTWDGKDDFGRLAANPGALSVRVRAGMTPKLAALVGENLYDNSGTPSTATDSKGNVYILSNGNGQTPFLRKYDAAGNYLKTLYPPPANLPSDSVKSYKINVLPGGGWVPRTYPTLGFGVHFTSLVMKGAVIARITADDRIMISGKSGSHLIDTNGCFTDTAYNPIAMKGVANNVITPKLLKALAPFREGPFVFERVAVDRTNDYVYWNGNHLISNWTNPVIRDIGIGLDNITVGPGGGSLYGWNLEGQSTWGFAFVKRYSRTSYAPVVYANTGNNSATGEIYFEWGAAGTPGNHRGIAVGWQKQVAAFTEASYLFQVPDTGGTVTAGSWDSPPVGTCRKLISCDPSADKNFAREGMMGVKYDPAGNFYVGLKKLYRPIVPSGFGMDPAFRNSGAVVKFKAESLAVFNPVTAALTGYEKVYPQPFGPFTMPANGQDPLGLGDAACTCRNSFFDVDPYGRLYVPNGVTCQIYVADNAGNNISVFGQYGNTDSRGGLSGPGQLLSAPAIPLAWPSSVGASEDYVYITDLVNARLVRVQMVYAIDNIPGLTDRFSASQTAAAKTGLKLAAYPNPFHPISNITLTLPAASHVSLGVYGVNGRLLRSLVSREFGPGMHGFSWDAKDAAGREVAPGVYIYKLVAGNRVLMERTILAK